MRKISILAALVLALSSCGAPVGNGPDAVAMQFLNKLGTMDIVGAASLASDDSAKMLQAFDAAMNGNVDAFKEILKANMGGNEMTPEEAEMAAGMLDGMIGGIVDQTKSEMEKAKQEYADNPPKIIKTEVSTDGQSATVTYQMGTREEETIDLIQVNGQWKVDFKKDMGM